MKLNDPIYTPGEACSVDADCTMLLESKCNATTSFCYGAVASLCPNSNILTEDVRNTIVDTHNSLRSQLANGQVYNIWTHKNVDQASRMLTMKYNCTAEANAYKWASQCLNKQSPQKERPQFKESRYFSSRRSYTQMDAAKRAMTQWWNEINQIGLPADNLFYFTRNITSFAKMAWDHTDQIGCAYATCGKGFHFVCQYGIGGTVEGKVIYNKGPPCSTCGAGRQCSKGLCMSP
ncbi:hypothetical protein Q1695_002530 [Nippostrongylus brasiliensis]|nr:hypothetical protein Q1695_002530 [Nippostrongylus brasiliensis]